MLLPTQKSSSTASCTASHRGTSCRAGMLQARHGAQDVLKICSTAVGLHGRRKLQCRAKESKETSEFVEVALNTSEPEAVEEILLALGASSSSCRRHLGVIEVTAQFPFAVDVGRLSRQLQGALGWPAPPQLRCRGLGRGTWIDFFPLCDGFEVRLPCHAASPQSPDSRRVLRLEGSTAFGAGDHPTTRGAAAFLGRSLRPGDRVLDYGTGSGVLAICAAMCGAEVLAVDLDADAVASARRSYALNGCEGSAEFRVVPESPGEAQALMRELLQDGADVVVANLLFRPLLALRELLVAACRPRGRLCLTGLRENEVAAVEEAYGESLAMEVEDLGAGWRLLTGRKGAKEMRGAILAGRGRLTAFEGSGGVPNAGGAFPGVRLGFRSLKHAPPEGKTP
ncbi:unnamed protein product [Effrenium voratum]|uniref:ETFB lysine methyltransferase n=1 Tax=Effrenium voratum TaxID=2562239 RepID=A0AA36MY96_9DINO|nr:unnamed protein product [Effrenium voratum]CAJ1436121.1 unnamed protein product [Effrenium voratum]